MRTRNSCLGMLFFLGLFAALLLVLVLSSNDPAAKPASIPSRNPITYPVATVFQEIYTTLGNESILGPAITDLFSYEKLSCQYFETALICLDPDSIDLNRISLYPLGLAFQEKISDPPDYNLDPSKARVVDGYSIDPEFVMLYDKLFGSMFVGRPLSQPRHNDAAGRLEQYFENVGFYHLDSDPPGTAHLLSYGVYSCDMSCRYQARLGSEIIAKTIPTEQPFLDALRGMNLAVLGSPLTQPYIADDGSLEQVLENAVVYAPLDTPQDVRLRPISRQLGLITSEPTPNQAFDPNTYLFVAVNGELGYPVPWVFYNYITAHGGLEISGPPISVPYRHDAEHYRQNFENYSLEFAPAAPQDLQVQMVALGSDYQNQADLEPNVVIRSTYTPDRLVMVVGEAYPRIDDKTDQLLYITVLNRSSQRPVANVEASVVLTLPDLSNQTYTSVPTNEEGLTVVTIPAHRDLPNGSIIGYEICLNIPSPEEICSHETYLIWR